MWYNSTFLIAQGDNVMGQKDRIEVSPQKNLIIRNVNINDDSIFNCRVIPEQINVKTHLHVQGPPLGVEISTAEKDDIAGTELQYHVGQQNLKFQCIVARARPGAKITWIHNVKLLSNNTCRNS